MVGRKGGREMEIKIVLSDTLEKMVERSAEELGIKKTEYVKGLIVEELKRGKMNGK